MNRTHSRSSPANTGLLRSLLIGLCVSFTLTVFLPMTVKAVSKTWVAKEGVSIVNGKTSGSTTADEPGELSLGWQEPAQPKRSVVSPTDTAETSVTHLSRVVFQPQSDSTNVSAGDTAEVGLRLVNAGNGSDTYDLSGGFVNGSTNWDTQTFIDTNGDSSSAGEPTTQKVGPLTGLGQVGDDTGLVLRFTVPDTTTPNSYEYVLKADSLRTEDPRPGLDTVALTLNVSSSDSVQITAPSSGHDTNVRSITVSGTGTSTTGDSISVSVNGRDTVASSLKAGNRWSVSPVRLKDMGDSVLARLHDGDSTSTVLDSDVIEVNYDPIAGTFPQNFAVTDTGPGSVTFNWSSFDSIPGTDPDTGTGFQEYLIVFEKGVTPDSTSSHRDADDDSLLSNIAQDTTTVTGLDKLDTYGFRIGYRDNVANTSVLSGSLTARTDTPDAPADIRFRSIDNTINDTALIADGSGTFGIRVLWENKGVESGTVTIDTGDLVFQEFDQQNNSEFNVSRLSDSEVTVPGGDTLYSRWSVDVPDTAADSLQGQFRVFFDTHPEFTTINIARIVEDVTSTSGGIDSWRTTTQSISIDAGSQNNQMIHDTSLVDLNDDIAVMVQQGDSSYIDTPLVNPQYGFRTNDAFQSAVKSANQTLESEPPTLFGEELINISIWKDEVGGDYLGDSTALLEDVKVSIPRPAQSPDEVQVAKLIPGQDKWEVIDRDPDVTSNTVTFNVTSNTDQSGAGFSIFRIVTGGGVAIDGSASEVVVYPNPFIPFDGKDKTGEYGAGQDQGIFFSAGTNRGFPSGTRLEIYTVTGELVAEKTLNTAGIVRWDARTRMGDPVRSGVYVFHIKTPDGSEKVGKLSVVR